MKNGWNWKCCLPHNSFVLKNIPSDHSSLVFTIGKIPSQTFDNITTCLLEEEQTMKNNEEIYKINMELLKHLVSYEKWKTMIFINKLVKYLLMVGYLGHEEDPRKSLGKKRGKGEIQRKMGFNLIPQWID